MKTPHTKIRLEGEIPRPVLKILKLEFGKAFEIKKQDEYVNAKDMDWFKKTKKSMTPGLFVRSYREVRGWTQEVLAEKLGGLTRQRVSEIEHDRRGVSKNLAKKLSGLFDAPVERFI